MIEKHLAPCLSQLAVAAGKDSLWKSLNHDLLMKTRDKSAKVCTIFKCRLLKDNCCYTCNSQFPIVKLYKKLMESQSVNCLQ